MKRFWILFYSNLLFSFRSMRRQGVYSLINIFGLTVSIMAFVLIFLYLQGEYAYDKCWSEYQNIYRVNESLIFNEREDHFALASYNVSQAMKHDYPEIEASTLIYHSSYSDDGPGITIWHEDKMLQLPSYSVADADFFKVFDYPFVEGDPQTALVEPRSLIISKHAAENFFAGESAIGKLLRINRSSYTVTAVIDTDACKTHLQFDALMSFSTLSNSVIEQMQRDWFWLIGYTYIKFSDSDAHKGFDEKLKLLVEQKIKPWIDGLSIEGDIDLHKEAIRDIHFNTRLQYDSHSNTNKRFVDMFGFIAAFLLLIASINYMNLATARSLKRAREIGVRKAIGAFRSQLVFQFLSESLLYTFLAFLLALLITHMILPFFTSLIGIDLSLATLLFENNGLSLVLLFLVILFLGILSGSFPAFVLSAFKPVKVLRPGLQLSHGNGFRSSHLRKGLVVLQFVISIGLIVSTIVINKQLTYMRKHDTGIHMDQVMVVHYPSDSTLHSKREVIKQQMLALPEVTHVSASNNLPGYKSGRLMFFLGDTAKPVVHTMNLYRVDHDFFDLLDVRLSAGRVFSKDFPNDATTAFVVNRAAAEFMGYDNPVGVNMNSGIGVKGKIVGMVENFHYASLHNPIEPLVFILNDDRASFLAVRFQTPEPAAAMQDIAAVWQDFDRNHYMNYSFLDTHFEQQYMREQRMLSLFGYFSLLVIVISCLGLFGLSAYTAEQRRKEIGIRKILGSSSYVIIQLLVKEFSLLVLVAGALALPLSWYLMASWLDGFAFRVWLNPLWFALGLFLALLIALLTVLSQAVKAVLDNPAEAIKYE
jgi:putative ABC transport system permease protein